MNEKKNGTAFCFYFILPPSSLIPSFPNPLAAGGTDKNKKEARPEYSGRASLSLQFLILQTAY